MEALLPVFIAVILAEFGGRTQAVGNALSFNHPQSQSTIFLALLLASSVSLIVAAIGGAVMAGLMAYDARSLLFGLALIFAGVPKLLSVKTPVVKRLASPFSSGLLGFGRIQFGDASQFIVLAVAARSGQPLLAVIGGLMGMLAANAPPILMQGDWPAKLPLRPVGIVAALVLTLAGAYTAVSALKLI